MAFSAGVGPASNNQGSGTSLAATLTGTTAGRHLVIGIGWESGGSSNLVSLTCSGETVVLVGSPVAASARIQLAYIAELASGGSKTITATFSTSTAAYMFVREFAGGDPSDFLDASNTGSATSTNPSISLTTTTDNCLIVGVETNTTGNPSPGSGYTDFGVSNGWSVFFEGEYDLDAGSAGAKTVDWSNASSTPWAIAAAAFTVLGPGSEGTADADLPMLSVVAESGETLGTSEFSLPQFSAFAQDQNNFELPLLVTTGAAPTGGLGATAAILPQFTSSASGTPGNSAVVTLPALTAEVTGLTGPAAAAEVSLPAFSTSATGDNEILASASVILPQFTVSADGGARSELELPAFSVTASGETGWGGSLASALPQLQASASGGTVGIGTADISLPQFSVQGVAVSGTTVSASANLRPLRLEAAGEVGTTAAGLLSLPRITLAGAGSAPSFGSASVALPSFYVAAAGSSALADTWRTWVLNLHTRALSEYTGFEFNSYARFAGHTLAASSGGVFKLDATKTDAGTPIEGLVRTGVHDYDTSWLKRIPRLYVNYSTEGDVEVRTITSEDGRRRYLLPHNNVVGVQQRRVPIGKGPKSRYWQYEITNRDGADFGLSSFVVYPELLRRRSQ